LVVDVDTGAVVQRLKYDPLGRVLEDSNKGFQPFGFHGGLYDDQTGLVTFGARDYHPEMGCFTTPDPAGFLVGSNLYIYSRADPVNFADPTGEAVQLAVGAVAVNMMRGGFIAAAEETAWQLGTKGGNWDMEATASVATAFGTGAVSMGWGTAVRIAGKSKRIVKALAKKGISRPRGTKIANDAGSAAIGASGSAVHNVLNDPDCPDKNVLKDGVVAGGLSNAAGRFGKTKVGRGLSNKVGDNAETAIGNFGSAGSKALDTGVGWLKTAGSYWKGKITGK
ncbi:MAG: RHS repeat-associated core domain-containing protein, partial [Proteobacteria bacterium]|nr:RHS repeat-associated core domain-containing protein [Pseudomonadota bacterium]